MRPRPAGRRPPRCVVPRGRGGRQVAARFRFSSTRSRIAAPAGSPAAGSTDMSSFRWACAFYGAFSFVPLGTAATVWFTP